MIWGTGELMVAKNEALTENEILPEFRFLEVENDLVTKDGQVKTVSTS